MLTLIFAEYICQLNIQRFSLLGALRNGAANGARCVIQNLKVRHPSAAEISNVCAEFYLSRAVVSANKAPCLVDKE